jgi:hypothetical protein
MREKRKKNQGPKKRCQTNKKEIVFLLTKKIKGAKVG